MKTWRLTFAAKIAVAALVLAVGSFMFGAGSVYATPYGTEITKYDGTVPDGFGTAKEDNAAESGMVQSQAWDLEGFFLNRINNKNLLTIVGGYNFYTGQWDGSYTGGVSDIMKAGDIFIDTNGDAVYSPKTIPGFEYNPGYKDVSNGLFKYDYVLDVNWAGGTYNIVELNSGSTLQDTEYGATYNKPSNPWIYKYFLSDVVKYSGSFTTYDGASMGDTGFDGWTGTNGAGQHYVATFDITAIGGSRLATFQNTMECGNDVLIGQSAVVPEPTTMLLLGAGLLGIGLVRRRIHHK